MRFLHKMLCTGGNYRPKTMLSFPGLTLFTKINLNSVKHATKPSLRAEAYAAVASEPFEPIFLQKVGEASGWSHESC